MDERQKPIEKLASTAREYLDLKTDELKLRTVESLSVAFSRFSALLIIMSILAIAVTACAFGLVLLLGKLLGNYAAGAFIVAGAFAIVLVILILLRKKLFLNSFTRMFIDIFYEEK